MNTTPTSTAGSTADVAGRIDLILRNEENMAKAEGFVRLQKIQKKIDSLRERGLLKRESFVSVLPGEFQKRFGCSSNRS